MMRLLAVLLLAALQEDRVAPLARDLESADLRKVYHAVSDLASLGEAALPALEARAKEAKGRPRDYLELAAEEIRAAKLLSGVPRARRISMKAADRNVVELLADLRTKTGVALALDNLMDEEKLPEVPVDIKDATMLEAFNEICRAGNVTVGMENRQFMLYHDGYSEVPQFFFEHYWMRLLSFTLMKTVEFRRPSTQTFRVTMEMLWDPTFTPIHFHPPKILEAVDDKGKNLIPAAPPPKPKDPQDDPVADDDEEPNSLLELLPPSAGSEKISILRGFSTISIPRSCITAAFEAPAEGSAKKAGEFTAKVVSIDPAMSMIEIEISSSARKPEELAKLPLQVSVSLKGGEQTRCVLHEPSYTEDRVSVSVQYYPLRLKEVQAKPGDERPLPALTIEKLEVSVVTALQERRVPFEFRDVKIK